jgi:pSer/pThr/pTyr-binding forkhead associated (FHA) protein
MPAPQLFSIFGLYDLAAHQLIRQPIQPEETSYQPRPAARPVLKLIHLTTGREFYLPGERGCIGRRSQIHGTIPEIDLVGIPNEGVVSRSHAQIFWDWNQHNYTILDTSKNGCYLNGNLLSQGVNYPLSNGDCNIGSGFKFEFCFT